MQKIFLFILLALISTLSASDIVQYVEPKPLSLFVYKTNDKSLGINEIKTKLALFKKVDENTSYFIEDMNYWFKIELPNDLKTGVYITNIYPFSFVMNSFKKEQLDINKSKYGVWGENPFDFVFKYKEKKDEQVYFFQIKKIEVRQPLMYVSQLKVFEEVKRLAKETPNYYTLEAKSFTYTLFSAMVIGLILMSALYSVVIYSYTRKKEFIYYALMQVAMTFFLFNAPFFYRVFSLDFLGMRELSLLVAFFATLFTKSFLETKEYLPKINMLLNVYLFLILLDALWINKAIMFDYKLYEVFGLLYLFTAVMRIKEGFRPAWFYLVGWIGLLLCIFLGNNFKMGHFILFLGVAIEAFMLAWALVYKMRVLEKS